MTIYKYPLAVQDRQDVLLPSGAKILSVQMQQGSLQLWALVKETARHVPYTIFIFPTGHILPKEYGLYLDTFQMQGGALVFHVFVHKKASN